MPCVFYDVTQGDIDVNCNGSVNWYLPSGNTGVLFHLQQLVYPSLRGDAEHSRLV